MDGRATICRIVSPGRVGTGFLITDRLVLTALHVVADRRTVQMPTAPIEVHFPSGSTVARPIEGAWDQLADWVLLECAQAPGPPPMPLLVVEHGRPAWDAYGFPDANPMGMRVDGDVVDLDATYDGVRSFQLFSRQAGAGDGMPVPGLSGSACVVDGAVIGLLRSSLLAGGKNVGGTLYACPIATVLEAIKDKYVPATTLMVMYRRRPEPVMRQRASEFTINLKLLKSPMFDRLEAGQKLTERFELIECLGEGKYSSAWRAIEQKHKITVALRTFNSAQMTDAARAERFFAGVAAMRKLEHPNIVRVLLSRASDGPWHFYVMEMIEGQDLRAAALRGSLMQGDLPPIFEAIGQALSYAHSQGILHGGLKPESILIDPRGVPHVADFAQSLGHESDSRSGGLGSFASPEVRAGGPPTVCADVYSLAMNALFALAGRDCTKAVVKQPHKTVAALAVTDAVRQVLLRGLAEAPSERYQDVASLTRDLVEALKTVAFTPAGDSRRIGECLDGKFTLTGIFSRSEHSTVFRGYQHATERDVAIKILGTDVAADSPEHERFTREAAAISRLSHPNLITLYDHGVSNGAAYMVMEALRGSFRPEFLNRIDETIIFHNLTRNQIGEIVAIQMGHLRQRLAEKHINLVLGKSAEELLSDAGYDPVYGARPLKRAIQKYIENPLSMEILKGSIPEGSTVTAEGNGDAIGFTIEPN